jgi:hypothetical protein
MVKLFGKHYNLCMEDIAVKHFWSTLAQIILVRSQLKGDQKDIYSRYHVIQPFAVQLVKLAGWGQVNLVTFSLML